MGKKKEKKYIKSLLRVHDFFAQFREIMMMKKKLYYVINNEKRYEKPETTLGIVHK